MQWPHMQTNIVNKLIYCSSEVACCSKFKKMAGFIILHEEDIPGAKLSKDPSVFNMEELKCCLESHSLKKLEKILTAQKW